MDKNSQAVNAAQAGQFDLAEKLFIEAFKTQPNNEGIFSNIIRIKMMRGKAVELIDLYQHYYSSRNRFLTDPQAGLAVAEAAKQTGETSTYSAILYDLSRRNQDPAASLMLSEYLLGHNKLQEAKSVLIEAIEVHGKDPSMLTNLAIAETNLGNYIMAESLYQEVINIAPYAFLGHFNMSKFKLATGQPEEAKKHLGRADRIVPNTPESRKLHEDINNSIGSAPSLKGNIFKLIEKNDWNNAYSLLKLSKQEHGTNEWLAPVCEMPKNYQVRLNALDTCDPLLQVSKHQLIKPDSNYRLELINTIKTDPSLTWNRIGKPTTGGQQTHELLAQSNNPHILKLNQMIKDFIAQKNNHISGENLQLSGWGVVLKPGGYQKKHTHTESFLSGVIYLQIPKLLDNNSHEGQIRFAGQQPLYVKPAEGMIVLFPSYLPHETIPYTCQGQRICIAFNATSHPVAGT